MQKKHKLIVYFICSFLLASKVIFENDIFIHSNNSLEKIWLFNDFYIIYIFFFNFLKSQTKNCKIKIFNIKKNNFSIQKKF